MDPCPLSAAGCDLEHNDREAPDQQRAALYPAVPPFSMPRTTTVHVLPMDCTLRGGNIKVYSNDVYELDPG
jgi:hypothetical protein